MQVNLKQICTDFLPEIQATGKEIYKQFKHRNQIDFSLKTSTDIVSKVDKDAEIRLVKRAQELLPHATFLTEEGTIESKEGTYKWIIDPLDGTTNFYYGIPFFSVSVALIHDNKIVIGIIYDIVNDDLFYAWQNGGFHMNDKQFKCSSIKNTNEVFLATGIPNFDFEEISSYLTSLNNMINNTRGIRRLGSAALELAYVAAGRFDAFFEIGLKPWDVAASICLIQEAGGIVTDLEGGNDYLYGKSILAAGKHVHADLLKAITL